MLQQTLEHYVTSIQAYEIPNSMWFYQCPKPPMPNRYEKLDDSKTRKDCYFCYNCFKDAYTDTNTRDNLSDTIDALVHYVLNKIYVYVTIIV